MGGSRLFCVCCTVSWLLCNALWSGNQAALFSPLYSQSSLSKSILSIFRIAWDLSPALEIEIRYICKSKKIFRRQEPFAIILFLYIIYFKGSAAKKKSGSIWETFVLFFNVFFFWVFISLHLLMWHMHPYTSVKEQLVGLDSHPSVDSRDCTEVVRLCHNPLAHSVFVVLNKSFIHL